MHCQFDKLTKNLAQSVKRRVATKKSAVWRLSKARPRHTDSVANEV